MHAEAVASDSQPISSVFTVSVQRIPSMPPWSQRAGHVTGQCSRASSSHCIHVSVIKPHDNPESMSAKLSHPQHALVGSPAYSASSQVAVSISPPRAGSHFEAEDDCHAPSSERETEGRAVSWPFATQPPAATATNATYPAMPRRMAS